MRLNKSVLTGLGIMAAVLGPPLAIEGPGPLSGLPLISVTHAARARVAAQPRDAQITVDAQRIRGPVPEVFRPGVFTFLANPPQYIQQKLVHDLRTLGTVQIDLGNEIMAQSRDLADLLLLLRTLDPFLLQIKNRGGQVMIGFSKFPRWLSSRPHDESPAMPEDSTPVALVSPPRDYSQWAAVVQAIAAHIRSLGITAHYKIGWEPNTQIWRGSQEEFFQLYRYAVLGVKRADAKAQVGGPGVNSLGPHWSQGANATPMLKAFFEYCARTPLPELGLARLPLEFVAFHQFGGSPASSYALGSQIIRRWLVEHGYEEQTPLFIGEWSESGGAFSPIRDHPYLASFIVASVVGMADAGITRQSFTSLVEQQVKDHTQFGGGLGLFTKDNVTKPAWHATVALSQLSGQWIDVKSTNPGLYATASRDQDRLAVVLTNFFPPREMFFQTYVETLRLQGHTQADFVRYFTSADQIREVFDGRANPSRFNVTGKLASDMASLREQLQGQITDLENRKDRPTRVKLALRHLAWLGGYTLQEFQINSTSGNPVRVSDAIDQFMNVQKAQMLSKLPGQFETLLAEKGYTLENRQRFSAFLSSADRRAFMDRLSGAERSDLIAMLMDAKVFQENMLGQISDRINNLPMVRLLQVRRQPQPKKDRLDLDLELEPNAVILLILE